jgi:DNA-binding GntR family transcriptional regulator
MLAGAWRPEAVGHDPNSAMNDPDPVRNESVKRTTLSERAYESIRRKIVIGAFPPRSKLVVAALANGLDLSATPINEALAALEREGLVSYLPHRGYFVSAVTRENVEEVYSVREVFELLAVRLAAQKADAATIERLEAILRQAQESIRLGDATTFSDLDLEFHRVIWTSTNNSLLVATTARAPGRFRGAFEEHCEIYQAIKKKNSAAAVVAMRKHIRSAKAALTQAIGATPSIAPSAPEARPAKQKRRLNRGA